MGRWDPLDFFGVGEDVLSTSVDQTTGVILAQLGDSVTGTSSSNGAEWWQQPGIASRPSPAVQGQAGCQTVTLRRGDQDVIIAMRDVRAANVIGNLKDGETTLYATGSDGKGMARVFLKQDGTVALATTDDNTNAGSAILFQITPDECRFHAPWGGFWFDRSGFHIQVDRGPTLDMSVCGGLPLPGINSFITFECGIFQADAASVLLGSSLTPLGYQPVAYGLSANPLTTPPVPIVTPTPGAPIGLICSNGVQVAQ